MDKKITVIGAGNMGGAMITGMVKSGLLPASSITVADLSNYKLEDMENRFPGIVTTEDSKQAVKNADVVIMAVKPGCFAKVATAIKASVQPTAIIVSIGAGVKLESLANWFGKEMKMVRSMPNIPALVGEGMSVLSGNVLVTDDDIHMVRQIFDSFGRTEIMPEHLMDAVTALSGSSPAYVFVLIEALADGAVLKGIPRNVAYSIAAQTILGAAKMLLETGMHPGELKDMVTSPAGTTIEAMAALESSGFRSAIIEAFRTCADRSTAIAKESE